MKLIIDEKLINLIASHRGKIQYEFEAMNESPLCHIHVLRHDGADDDWIYIACKDEGGSMGIVFQHLQRLLTMPRADYEAEMDDGSSE
jgi:hypothetical protein